jgi:hypothetical protein
VRVSPLATADSVELGASAIALAAATIAKEAVPPRREGLVFAIDTANNPTFRNMARVSPCRTSRPDPWLETHTLGPALGRLSPTRHAGRMSLRALFRRRLVTLGSHEGI